MKSEGTSTNNMEPYVSLWGREHISVDCTLTYYLESLEHLRETRCLKHFSQNSRAISKCSANLHLILLQEFTAHLVGIAKEIYEIQKL